MMSAWVVVCVSRRKENEYEWRDENGKVFEIPWLLVDMIYMWAGEDDENVCDTLVTCWMM